MSAVLDERLPTLRAGWYWTTMGEIAEVIGGGTPRTTDPTNFEGGDVAWITPADLSGYTEKYISRGARFITRRGLESSSARLLPAGTVLFTSRAPIGYVAIARNPVATNQGFKSFVLKDGVLPEYVYWWLKGSKQRAEALASGTTFLELSGTNAKRLPIPIAPVEEQRCIVAEIEKQFSRLDEAVANLKRIKANLERYEVTVLEAAVEGRLVPTEAEIACREGRSYETGSQLLGRVLQERRRSWNGRGTYRDPETPGVGGLPPLPEGWAWARLEAVAALKGGITVDKKRRDPTSRPVPYLRVANVQRGYLDLDEVKEIEAPEADIEELRLRPGDVLFNEGGDRDKLGRGWIWEGQIAECIHQNHVFRARPYLADVSGKLISWWGNTFGKDYFLREGKQTTNLASINMTKLCAFPVPIPPFAEQRRIIAEVDRRLSIVREVEAEVDANLERAQGLRQAVLQRSFTGGCP